MSDIVVEGKNRDFNGSDRNGRPFRDFGAPTPLSRRLDPFQAAWLVRLLSDRWQTLHQSLGTWREKMAKWERMSEDNYTDRKDRMDPVNESSIRDIFHDQNDTLGMVGGFNDFHFAQVKDDVFGTTPWLAVVPEGRDDLDLADAMTKHSQWKLSHSDVEPALIDALKISTWGGTAFVKGVHKREPETYFRQAMVAVNARTKQPYFKALDPATGALVLAAQGDYIETADDLAAVGISDEQKEWMEMDLEETVMVYDNVSAAVVDYRDIAFESTANDLSLDHTDVFVRFKMGMLDAMKTYGIPQEMESVLFGCLTGYDEDVRDHRDETRREEVETPEKNANPQITLVEGFSRVAPFGDGRMVRVHSVFSPDMNALFRVDYLPAVVPGGTLPIFPVRINRIPNRIFGRGYFEKYENPNDAVDRQYNLMTFRNRAGAHVWTGFQPEALKDWDGVATVMPDPRTPVSLAVGKTINDLIQFAAAPDTNGRADSLLNQMLQMGQMRSGITSAAQGELKGVPSANTATGTRDIQSRGAVLVKATSSEQIEDLRKAVEFLVLLIYANQDTDETFTWAEGRAPMLVEIEASEVMGLKADVSLRLTQSRNREQLERSMAAMQVIQQWIMIPEHEKTAVRPLFVQALSSMGFHAAEDIIRPGITDLPSLLAILPPELAAQLQAVMQQAGMIAPEGGAPSAAPVAPGPGNS